MIPEVVNQELWDAYLWLMALAVGLGFGASLPPQRPLATWLGDMFVRIGLSGLMIWTIATAFWGLRELFNMRLVIPFTPLEAYLEYLTFWGAALTGGTTFLLFATTLFLRAIFSRPEVVSDAPSIPQKIVVRVRLPQEAQLASKDLRPVVKHVYVRPSSRREEA